MADYKTIALGLIEENPEFYEQLRSSKRLLTAMDAYAADLKARHEHWKAQISRAKAESGESQLAAEALELAIEDLRDRLPSASPKDETEPMSLDSAISYLRRHTPPA